MWHDRRYHRLLATASRWKVTTSVYAFVRRHNEFDKFMHQNPLRLFVCPGNAKKNLAPLNYRSTSNRFQKKKIYQTRTERVNIKILPLVPRLSFPIDKLHRKTNPSSPETLRIVGITRSVTRVAVRYRRSAGWLARTPKGSYNQRREDPDAPHPGLH